jgi:hypothetical protein
MNRRMKIALAGILAVFALTAGCTGAGNYGNMRVEDKGGMAVETLVNNSQNYNVYYAGTPGYPVAVLFDPKADGKTVKVADRWQSVTDQATISKHVQIIGMHGYGANIPRLWKLLGQNESVFGYVYTTATKLSTNAADADTMFVDY